MSANKYLLLLFFIFIAIVANADILNLGTVGRVYDITENDFADWLHNQLESKRAFVDAFNKEQKTHFVENVDKLYKVNFDYPTTTKYSKRVLDPTVTLSHDIQDQYGNILYHKGLRINPFKYTFFSHKYLFINCSDKKQIALFKKLAVQNRVPILVLGVDGDIRDYDEAVKNDHNIQHAPAAKADKNMLTRFGIRSVPTIAYQTGLTLTIEEIPVQRGK